jgi:hypothetical protein
VGTTQGAGRVGGVTKRSLSGKSAVPV